MATVARDDARAVAAFGTLGQIGTSRWPLVASWLLASGFNGPALLALAALDRHASAWDVEPLIPDVLREIGTPSIDTNEAALVLGATYAIAEPDGDAQHTVIRVLAEAAARLGYPAGRLSECYYAEEFLDCDCLGADQADHLEHALRTSISLEVTAELAKALTDLP
jgi:hypothetical protein